MIKLIVACDLNGVIGKDSDMPWSKDLPYDLQRFKELTTGHIVVCGRKTFESLGSKPLPMRENVVMTSNPKEYKNGKNLFFVDSIEKIFSEYDLVAGDQDLWVIGGLSVYKQFMPYVQEVYLTIVQEQFEGDTKLEPEFFDEIKNNFKDDGYQGVKLRDPDNKHDVTFHKFIRVRGEHN